MKRSDIQIGDILIFIDKAFPESLGVEYEVISLRFDRYSQDTIETVLTFIPEQVRKKRKKDIDLLNKYIKERISIFPHIDVLKLKYRKPHVYSPVNMTGRYRTIGD